MNISYENKNKTELFCNILLGECFAVDINTPDQMICMRVWGECDEYSAVDLESGKFLCFDYNEKVVPIKTELKVKSYD